MKEYILKPIMTPQTVSLSTSFDKPATIKIIPPRQPLPTAVIDPGKPLLKLGLDVHLEFIMGQVLYGTGLRLLELLRLRIQDIDFERNQIVVRAAA
jgi:hypothetical protein